MDMDYQLDPRVDGADAPPTQGGAQVEMAAADPRPRSSQPDHSGDHRAASHLPAVVGRVESNPGHGVHPRVWHGGIWHHVQW